jgi:uncharacterized protein with von Willebrand factor type A (vWA) domain
VRAKRWWLIVQQSQELEQFKEITGIEDLGNVFPQQFANIENLAGLGQLSREQIASAVPHIPNLLEVQKDSIQKLETVIEKVGASQQAAFGIVAKSLDAQYRILEDLAKSATTDETRLKLAEVVERVGQHGREIAQSMNRKLIVPFRGRCTTHSATSAG